MLITVHQIAKRIRQPKLIKAVDNDPPRLIISDYHLEYWLPPITHVSQHNVW